jgi:hypothetical protein
MRRMALPQGNVLLLKRRCNAFDPCNALARSLQRAGSFLGMRIALFCFSPFSRGE